MALAKAVVTGSVFRAPEKRFTQNNVPVSSFVLNIGDREEMLIRVVVLAIYLLSSFMRLKTSLILSKNPIINLL